MDLFWIDQSLAVSTRPRGGDWLDDEMADLEREGVDVLVSCLTPSEEFDLELIDEAAAARRRNIEFLRIPIEDFGTPPSESAVLEVVDRIEWRRSTGGRVAIHCRQGLGRSPLVGAAVLVNAGTEPDEAWALIGERRHRTVPETDDQREWIRRFADRAKLPNGLIE